MAIWALGLPAQAVMIQRLLQATKGVLEHANVRLWPWLDRAVSVVWVTPNVHKIHHSREVAEANSNYANLLTVYDRVLGTYTPADRATAVVYGLDDVDPRQAASFRGLLSMPFDGRSEYESRDRAETQTEPQVRAAQL
jgi:sterol desaturase/sphingolipid hydroxylase (fatty acid hydroxylase superfamily)